MGKSKNKYIEFAGKKYSFNLNKIKEVCLTASQNSGSNEIEITNVYETNGDGDYTLASKVEHETKVNKNPQNDMIIYDIVKILMISLLENDNIKEMFQMDFGTALAINTLISWGILEEITE